MLVHIQKATMHLFVDSQFISPWAMSAFVALTEKGLPFELKPVDLQAGSHLVPGLAQTLPTRRVPTLVDGTFSLAESTAITEYLEDIQPHPPLYPAEPRQRAQARQIQAWIRSDLTAIRGERPTEVVFLGAEAKPLSPQAKAAAQKLFSLAQAFMAPADEYLFGQWSIVDVDLALMLKRLVGAEDGVPAALAEYAERQWARPSVQAWIRNMEAAA